MSLSLKRRYPFCGSPLSSSFTPDCASPVEPKVPAFPELEDIVMSGCPPVTNQFHSLPHTKATTLPVMTSSSTAPLSYQQHSSHSTSTSASSSNNSSPTTTISATESPTTEADSSPITTILSLSDFSSKTMGRNSTEDLKIVPPASTAGSSSPQSISPSKKARNAKNLSLNVPPPAGIARAQPTGVDPSLQGASPRSMSAPNSPAFILPPPPPAPKRKPSNLGLTIKLPSTLGQSSGIQAVGKGGLRHHQSSPSLFSPGPGSLSRGMTLPPIGGSRLYHPPRAMVPESIPSSQSSSSSISPPRSPPPVLTEMDEEEDEPRSGEAKSPAYPAGPVCIFEPNVYLFAEPDAELASEFDVVINVAREVLNPFDVRDRQLADKLREERRMSRRISLAPETGCTDATFTTAFEEATFSPIRTPTTTRSGKTEYIHMPWDHNTPIVDELPELVKIIKDRVADGKKVLVHCQCGVSRSASLLIAYALFLKPEQTVQEAYDTVKRRSKWIGPNMSLIFQLLEWKKRLGKEDMGQPGFRPGMMGKQSSAPNNNFGRKGRNTLSAENDEGEDMAEPLTAPLPQRPPPASPVHLKPTNTKHHHIPQMVRTRSENGGMLSDVMPGPSSAPPGMMTIPHKNFPEAVADPPNPAESDFSSIQHDSSSYAFTNETQQQKERRIGPIRPEDSNKPLNFGQSHEEAPQTPSFRSPRNSGYFGFGIPLRREMPGFVLEDPRSPNRGTEAPVIRSIFDVL